jgi:hypothetical protein
MTCGETWNLFDSFLPHHLQCVTWLPSPPFDVIKSEFLGAPVNSSLINSVRWKMYLNCLRKFGHFVDLLVCKVSLAIQSASHSHSGLDIAGSDLESDMIILDCSFSRGFDKKSKAVSFAVYYAACREGSCDMSAVALLMQQIKCHGPGFINLLRH